MAESRTLEERMGSTRPRLPTAGTCARHGVSAIAPSRLPSAFTPHGCGGFPDEFEHPIGPLPVALLLRLAQLFVRRVDLPSPPLDVLGGQVVEQVAGPVRPLLVLQGGEPLPD